MKRKLLLTPVIVAVFFAALSCSRSDTPTGDTSRKTNSDPNTNSPPSEKRYPPPTNAQASSEFKKEVALFGIGFSVESPNSNSGNTITVTPRGLSVSNDSFTSPATGEVIDAQVGDLNADSSPEVYVFVRERGGSQETSVIAYGTNSKKSMSEFIMPVPDPKTKEYTGYNGNDQFEVVENVLARRFPVYRTEGSKLVPSGKTRTVQYKIKPGEATWQFYILRTDEY